MDKIQAHLPEEPNSFIGRERELGELRWMLRHVRALTLCGPGGIGKTRLALRILAEAADEFPEGVCFVELADLRHPDQVASRVAAVTGVSEEAGRPLAETLADALRPRRLLLALDNCEHLIDACAQLSRQLLAGSPGLRLLTTSREPLRIAAETIWRVPPLSMAPVGTDPAAREAHRYEAIRLFADRAAASRPGFVVGPDNAAAVTSICRALDGLPLAIELAAARVRALSVEEISARLDDRFGLLTTGDRSAAPRQQTLSAAIEWSYELLTAPERALFTRLSVFTGWSLEMAEQVCSDDDIPARDVLGLITALVDKSLVVPDPAVLGQTRYRMLDTIREYASGRLADTGELARFQAAFRDYALRTAEQNLAIGLARVPATWASPRRRLPPLRRRRQQRVRGAELVPGSAGRGGGTAAVHRGQPVLDRVGQLHRRRRMAGLVPGPGLVRRSRRSPGRGHGGPRAARPVQRSGRGRVSGRAGAEAVPRRQATGSGPRSR